MGKERPFRDTVLDIKAHLESKVKIFVFELRKISHFSIVLYQIFFHHQRASQNLPYPHQI